MPTPLITVLPLSIAASLMRFVPWGVLTVPVITHAVVLTTVSLPPDRVKPGPSSGRQEPLTLPVDPIVNAQRVQKLPSPAVAPWTWTRQLPASCACVHAAPADEATRSATPKVATPEIVERRIGPLRAKRPIPLVARRRPAKAPAARRRAGAASRRPS